MRWRGKTLDVIQKRRFLLPTFTQLPYISAYRPFKQVADITVAFKRRKRLRLKIPLRWLEDFIIAHAVMVKWKTSPFQFISEQIKDYFGGEYIITHPNYLLERKLPASGRFASCTPHLTFPRLSFLPFFVSIA